MKELMRDLLAELYDDGYEIKDILKTFASLANEEEKKREENLCFWKDGVNDDYVAELGEKVIHRELTEEDSIDLLILTLPAATRAKLNYEDYKSIKKEFNFINKKIDNLFTF